MQGDRISITASERIKAPTSITFKITTTTDVEIKVLKLILDRGQFKGIGQWSNAQFGNFTYTIVAL
jgi:6-phosphogluconate dehydrogenase